jgi:CheY-like chemotaxis protein
MFQVSEVLKKVPFFRTLGRDGIDFIIERLKFKPFNQDEIICKTGDPGDKMYIIINGKVNVQVPGSKENKESVVATLGGGDYFGEMALLTGEPRSATVVTTEPSEMFILGKTDFDLIVERFPSITLSMGKIMSQRLRDTLQKAGEKGSTKTTPSIKGNLKEKRLVDILKFCENNSLNGKVIVQRGEEHGELSYEKGVLQKIKFGNESEDEALDILLNWEDGNFLIEPRPFEMDNAEMVFKDDDQKSRVVIVNNSIVVQKVLQKTFESMGYEVYTVDTAAKGLKLVESLSPHVVISDTKLPDSSGIEFIQRLREKNDINVILLADQSNQNTLQEQMSGLKNVSLTRSQEVGEVVKVVESILA